MVKRPFPIGLVFFASINCFELWDECSGFESALPPSVDGRLCATVIISASAAQDNSDYATTISWNGNSFRQAVALHSKCQVGVGFDSAIIYAL